MIGLLVASHQTDPSALNPSGPAHGARATTQPVHCQPGLTRPFTGIAINPGIAAHARSFQHVTHSRIQVIEFYNPFTGPFQRWEAEEVTALGDLPLIQLNPRRAPAARIVAGWYDGAIRRYADSVKEFRCKVVISFGHEMNGFWYRWGLPWTKPAAFIAAWRHIADIFATQLRNIRRVTSKPVYIAETGVAGGPDQTWQIRTLFAALKKYKLSG